MLDYIYLATAVNNLLKELLRTKGSVPSILFTLRQLISLFLVAFMWIIDFIPSQVLSIFCYVLGRNFDSNLL